MFHLKILKFLQFKNSQMPYNKNILKILCIYFLIRLYHILTWVRQSQVLRYTPSLTHREAGGRLLHSHVRGDMMASEAERDLSKVGCLGSNCLRNYTQGPSPESLDFPLQPSFFNPYFWPKYHKIHMIWWLLKHFQVISISWFGKCFNYFKTNYLVAWWAISFSLNLCEFC